MLINKELCAVAVALLAVSSIGYWLGASRTGARYEKMIQAKEIAVLEAQQQERKEHDAKLIEATNLLRDELNQSNDLARARGADVERLRNANAKLQARIKARAYSLKVQDWLQRVKDFYSSMEQNTTH